MKPVEYQEKYLIQINAVFTKTREIKTAEKIEFYCHYCKKKRGFRKIGDALKSLKLYGHSYQCDDCFQLKIKNRPESWRENVKKACQTEKKKQTAIENSKKYVEKYKREDVIRIVSPFWKIDLPEHYFKENKIIGHCIECNNSSKKSIKRFLSTALKGESGCRNCHFNKMQTEEFSKKMKQASLSVDRSKQSKSLLAYFQTLTSEERSVIYGRKIDANLARERMKKRWESNKEEMIKTTTENNRNPQKILKQIRSIKEYWSHQSKEQRQVHHKKVVKGLLEKTGYANPLFNPITREKVFSGKGMTKPEKIINEMLSNRGFNYKYQYDMNGKIWDFVIFEEENPVLIIETDGEFAHCLKSDPFYNNNKQANDEIRFYQAPEGVKLLVIDGLNAKQAIPEIIEALGLHYYDWIDSIFAECVLSDFPYPEYTERRLLTDWNNLKRQDIYHEKRMPANSIITSFHQSIYHCNIKGKVSPFMAWNDVVLLMRCIQNRFIYRSNLSSQQIARGFERNKIAPRVTVFQPSLARELLEKYAEKAKTVVDPFSGFSGRMLGSLSLDKKYTGYDINGTVIKESKDILRFLSLQANLAVEPIEEVIDNNEYGVLLTCPPYGNKEIWFTGQNCFDADYYIEMCLKKFKAEMYLFVVDETTKFKNYIVEKIVRKSHMHLSEELVIKI